jgi:hypothetical protein
MPAGSVANRLVEVYGFTTIRCAFKRQFWAEMFLSKLKAELTENADRRALDD